MPVSCIKDNIWYYYTSIKYSNTFLTKQLSIGQQSSNRHIARASDARPPHADTRVTGCAPPVQQYRLPQPTDTDVQIMD